MKKRLRILSILAILLVTMLSPMGFQTAQAADNLATVEIPVYKVISGGTPDKAETFTFLLTALKNAPMPSESANGIKTADISGAGSTTFGAIAYTEPGNYNYTISEVKKDSTAYEYDATVYRLTVQVTWKKEPAGELQAVMYLVKQDDTAKQAKAVFTNQYIASTESSSSSVEVIGNDTPLSNTTDTPKTGDTSRDDIWWLLIGVAAIGIEIALWIAMRKKED